MGRALQPAPAGHPAAFCYERRRPEETTLYLVVQEQLETFLAQVEAKTGSGLPEFVKDEFDAFLECGILAHGFVRLRCAECAHEKLVAFSCKRRGFCPSCGARRMAESAAHLVDQVIPRVPVRQWVLSFPIPLRILFAAHPQLLAPVLQIIHRVIARFLIKQAGLKRCAADTGAITLIQRFGSAANLNIHLHCLVLDGVYRGTGDEALFQEARAPSRAELEGLLEKIIARLMKMLTRLGYLVEEQGVSYLADLDADNPLRSLQAASCTYRIALGHLIRFHGVLAPNARLRAAIVPGPAENKSEHAAEHAHDAPARTSWARLLKRVFAIDVEHCPYCGGDLKIISAIEEPAVIVRILTPLGLPARAPPRSPARPLALFQTA